MAINQINEATFDYAMMLSVINISYKTQADITITNFDNDSAPQVTAGSIFANNGAIFENTTLATPTGYAGISNSTTFYLYLDVEPTPTFIFTNTAPTFSDAKQDWYNGNDRAFYSMYKNSGGTLYQFKSKLLRPEEIGNHGSIGSLITAASTSWSISTEYLPGTTVNGNTLIYSNAAASVGGPLSAELTGNIRVTTGAQQSASLTGTWRLLSRIYMGTSSSNIPIGLFQRIA